ncbi:uncharacterized protein G2W53_010037 [Senna tora]|uniref:Uncharacterized protein n=1 Tax=Senna tora TaxID=362788 RepID=A0A834WZ79_9FABA|nr:uncharacterized protein G2W53_010037 [Senna tora]
MRSCCIGNPSGSNARMGLVITWEVWQVMYRHILNGKLRVNLKLIQDAQVQTCCRTSESNGCVRIVLGIRVGLMLEFDSFSYGSGSIARMGLEIGREMCQVISKHILKGKPRLNLERIREAQVRTCCRTSESYRCVRVVLGIRVRLMLEWDS